MVEAARVVATGVDVLDQASMLLVGAAESEYSEMPFTESRVNQQGALGSNNQRLCPMLMSNANAFCRMAPSLRFISLEILATEVLLFE